MSNLKGKCWKFNFILDYSVLSTAYTLIRPVSSKAAGCFQMLSIHANSEEKINHDCNYIRIRKQDTQSQLQLYLHISHIKQCL